MNPRLTDQAVSELPLAAARAELLEEIMATPVLEDRETARVDHRARRWLVPLVVAASVAAAVAVPSWLLSADDTATPAPPASAPSDQVAHEWVVLDAPGWTITYTSNSHGAREVGYEKGAASVDVHLRPANALDSYTTDRQHIDHPKVEPGEPVQLLGEDALLWAYSATDHTVIGAVDGKVFPEVRGSGMDKAAYLTLLGQLRWTDQAGFEASQPEAFVTSGERAATIDQMLADMVVPAGFEPPTSKESDPYQLGARVAGAVACAWLGEFETATASGDTAAADTAADALAGSHDWQVLHDMNTEGDYPEVVWDFADEVAAGRVPEGYRGGLGCP